MSGPGEAATDGVDDDLVLCHQEPIRVPGSIQPHGVLLALDGPELHVRRASASVEPLLGRPLGGVLDAPLDASLGGAPTRAVRAAIATLERPVADAGTGGAIGRTRDDTDALSGRRTEAFELALEVRGEPRRCDASVHRAAGYVVLELDNLRAPDRDVPRPELSIGGIQQLVRRLHAARSVDALCGTIVEEVRALSGFDRVMVYRFHDDGHGEVVAESVVDGRPPYLGLHYPEGDIPAQARELYRRSWIRCIAEVPYAPSPILPAEAASLDLGFAHLRSVSPIHVEYLVNMGVGASMSISLLDGERLWGLVACHHGVGRHVPAAMRAACELLGTTFSLLLPSLDAAEEARTEAELRDVERRLLARMGESMPFVDGAFGDLPSLADLVVADGVASVSGSAVRRSGTTPSEAQVVAFAGWLERAVSEPVFATERVGELCPAASDWPGEIAGALVIEISRARGQYLMAFREARARKVRWAGRPDERHVVARADGAGRRLAPRTSFALWEQSVEGASLPWRPIELRCAETLRQATLSLIVGRTEEVLRLNRELERSRDDLQSFAHIAAHDLKEPLRGIDNYVAFLLEEHGGALDPGALRKIETIARLADRGSALTSALLEFAEVGANATSPAPFALDDVVDEVLETVAPELERRGIEPRVRRPLPTIVGDRMQMGQILLNLVGNAIKYGDKPDRWIAIEAEPRSSRSDVWLGDEHLDRRSHVVRVRDNGIGIAPEHHEDVFKLFRRLHAPGHHEGGSGLGLAIVKRVVELCGGQVALESEPGVGSTFLFTFGEPDEPTGPPR